jgi:hypothetical protein
MDYFILNISSCYLSRIKWKTYELKLKDAYSSRFKAVKEFKGACVIYRNREIISGQQIFWLSIKRMFITHIRILFLISSMKLTPGVYRS